MAIVAFGWASQYAPGVIQQRYGHLPAQLPEVAGYVAVVECDRLGELLYIRPEGSVVWELFLVTDCSGHAATTAWMRNNNIPVEVDHETARRWGTVGRGMRVEITDYAEHDYADLMN